MTHHDSEADLRPRPEEGAWQVDHTADLALRVKARTLPALFEQAALGMGRLARGEDPPDDPGSGHPSEVREVAVEGLDCEELLVCWLNELLYLGETERLWVADIESLEIGAEGARFTMGAREEDTCPAMGAREEDICPTLPAQHEDARGERARETDRCEGSWLRARCRVRPGGGSPIKAVTYHGLRIDPQARGGYDQLIVFDT